MRRLPEAAAVLALTGAGLWSLAETAGLSDGGFLAAGGLAAPSAGFACGLAAGPAAGGLADGAAGLGGTFAGGVPGLAGPLAPGVAGFGWMLPAGFDCG